MDTGELIRDAENTDEELNPKWLPERLERAKRSAIQSLLDELGFADVDNLRQTLAAQQDTITALTGERDSAQAQAITAESARQQALIDAAFTVEAAQYDFINPDEARALADLSQVAVDEANSVTGIREAFAELLETRPHLLRRRPTPATDSRRSGARGNMQPNTVDEMSPEQLEEIKRKFKLW